MKKRILIISGAVVLVLLLVGAAFIGGRLLNGQGLLGLSHGPVVITGPGGKTSIQFKPGDIQPSQELPQTPADVKGIFDHRQNNSFFVGTGNFTMIAQKDPQTGKVTTSTSHTGPVVEVVVTNQTTIYHDTTMEQFNGPPPSGQKIQQVVEAGSLSDIGQGSSITVWGRKSGDRTIADVLVYTTPTLLTK